MIKKFNIFGISTTLQYNIHFCINFRINSKLKGEERQKIIETRLPCKHSMGLKINVKADVRRKREPEQDGYTEVYRPL